MNIQYLGPLPKKTHLTIEPSDEPDAVLVESRCDCGSVAAWKLPRSNFEAFHSGGALIQRCLPMLSADDRERLISGTCPKCWDILFGDEEE